MDIQSVNAMSNTASASSVTSTTQQSTSLMSLGQKGDEIEGLITKVSDKISINFNGKEVSVSRSAVQNATEGETRRFRIMDISDKSIVLKEVGTNTESAKNIQAFCTKVETDQAAFSKRLEEAQKEKKSEDEEAENLEDTANRMSAEDCEELSKEPYDYKQYEMERLERALDRIKEQRETKDQAIVNEIQSNKESREEIEKVARKALLDSPYADQIIEKLQSSNLPITEANVVKIASAMTLTESVANLTDSGYSYLIRNELEQSIGNIYKASYSAAGTKEAALKKEDFEQLKSQVDKVIKDAGFEVNEETTAQAKWILDNRLPLTTGTFAKLNELKSLKENFSSEDAIGKVISSMERGVSPEDTILGSDSSEAIRKALEDIKTISDEAIIAANRQYENKEITLSILKQIQNSINHNGKAADTGNMVVTDSNHNVLSKQMEVAGNYSQVDINAVTTKRQLEEIRLKMTLEAGQTMESKGIHVDTTSLEKVVSELREIEDDYYRNLLKESGAAQTSSNIDLLRETTQKVNELKQMPSELLGSTFGKRDIATVNSLHESGSTIQATFSKANESYDALMTSPRKDMGDSIQKAFKNSTESILKDLGLDDTQANQRAVRILGYNGMDITEESIDQMKMYDAKVNYLLNNLHPAVTVDMIKEGKNPLDTPIDQLNADITARKEQLGVSAEEGYAKYLWQLEKQDGITEDERKAYIGMYRLLNNVEKTDGAAIGAVVGADQEVTLGNLLTAVRTMKSGGVDKSVDDNFGAIESLTFSKDTITSQINAGFDAVKETAASSEHVTGNIEDDTVSYNQILLQDIMENITPAKLGSIMKDPDMMGKSLEEVKEALESYEAIDEVEDAYYEQQVKEIRDLADRSENVISFLKKFDIPVTINSIQSAQVLLNGDGNLYKQLGIKAESSMADNTVKEELKESMSAVSDQMGSEEELLSSMRAVAESAERLISQKLSNPQATSKDIDELRLLSGTIRLTSALSRNEHYEIPVVVGDSITNINLTVIKNDSEQGKIQMSVNSEEFGVINADFTVEQGSVKGLLLSDSRSTMEQLKGYTGELEQSIKDQGLELKQLNYGVERVTTDTYIGKSSSKAQEVTDESANAKVDTKNLYQIAKSFVVIIKNMEQAKKGL
ncbi:MAG TPA: DUF6240 domain-containing protein [Lachnospiraceae bacterium]|nr:DUF6240 domain-containing protein [Lachnospiraceae bacterium]